MSWKDSRFSGQDNSIATYAPKLKKEDGRIDWSKPAVEIHNKVRGLLPWPGAYTYYDKKILKILQTEVSGSPLAKDMKSGEVAAVERARGIVVCAGAGNIVIKYLQLEGKRPLDADSFVRGHKIGKGYRFA